MREERYWFILSILSIGTGGFFAFLVGMSRTPFGHQFFPENYFYYALVGHVDLAIVLWLMSFSVLFWTRIFGDKELEKIPLLLSYMGYVLISLSVLLALGKPVPNNYVPVLVHPLFFAGLILYFSGFSYKLARYMNKAIKSILSEDPLVNSASTGVVTALLMIISYIPSFFKSGNAQEYLLYFERLFWIPGHIQQFVNGTLLLIGWYYLLKLEGRKLKLGLLKYANLSFILFSFFTFILLFIFEDPIQRESKVWSEIAYAVGLGIPIFIHSINILKNIRLKLNVFSTALILSFVLYYTGILIAYLGLSNDLRVPAHYHGAVTSITLVLMAISYGLLREYGYKKVIGKMARIQPYFYGIGMILFVLSLYWAGKKGAPRKTYGVDYVNDPSLILYLALMGVGTILAVIGGVMFVVYVLSSLLLRERVGLNEREKG